MVEALKNMFMTDILMLGIGFVLIIRLATKHPNASGGIARGLFGLFFRR